MQNTTIISYKLNVEAFKLQLQVRIHMKLNETLMS